MDRKQKIQRGRIMGGAPMRVPGEFYVLTRSPGRIFMESAEGIGISAVAVWIFSTRENADVSAEGISDLMSVGVLAIPGDNFLGGFLSGLPEQGCGVVFLDNIALPVTEEGAVALSQGPLMEGLGSDSPEEWGRSVAEGTWRGASLFLLMAMLGADLSSLDREKLDSEDAVQELNLLWQHYSNGKTRWLDMATVNRVFMGG